MEDAADQATFAMQQVDADTMFEASFTGDTYADAQETFFKRLSDALAKRLAQTVGPEALAATPKAPMSLDLLLQARAAAAG
jgi:hypothetical protein